VNGTLFFVAYNSVGGKDLWRSDGSPAGTVLVKNLYSYQISSSPAYLTNVNGTLFFVADAPIIGTELWQIDPYGTPVQVADIYPGSGNSSPANLTNVNGTLFFAAKGRNMGVELWKSNGTPGGTVLVKDIYPGAGNSSPTSLTNVNGTLFFVADDGVGGTELWKSNGSAAGTVRLRDIYAGPTSSSPANLTSATGMLFFSANDGVGGTELWKSDGSVAGTMRLRDIYVGPGSSSPTSLTSATGMLFFAANDGSNGMELWSSDGTPAGTVLIKDVLPGATGSVPQNIAQIRSSKRVLFAANDGVAGLELWVSDGTPAGTTPLQDIAIGAAHSSPASFTLAGSAIFFRASDTTTGAELWSVPAAGFNSQPNATDAAITVHANQVFSSMLAATDPDGDVLAFSIVANAAHGTAQFTNPATGAFSYTPDPGYVGSDSFTFRAGDGLLNSNVATLSISVTNIAPVATGASISIHANRVFSGVLLGSDADADPRTFSIATNAVHGAAQITNAATGAFTYTPNPGYVGADGFSFKVNDGVADSNVASVSVSVTNMAPTANSANVAVHAGRVRSGTLVAGDADGDTLHFSIVANGHKGVATITNATTGAFTYTPAHGALGSDSFTFKVNDGVTNSNVATVALNITNKPPVVISASVSTATNRGVSGQLFGFDDDGDSFSFHIVTNGTKGVATLTNPATGTFTYMPNQDAAGSDSFTFKANDGIADSNSATVTVQINYMVYLPYIRQ